MDIFQFIKEKVPSRARAKLLHVMQDRWSEFDIHVDFQYLVGKPIEEIDGEKLWYQLIRTNGIGKKTVLDLAISLKEDFGIDVMSLTHDHKVTDFSLEEKGPVGICRICEVRMVPVGWTKER